MAIVINIGRKNEVCPAWLLLTRLQSVVTLCSGSDRLAGAWAYADWGERGSFNPENSVLTLCYGVGVEWNCEWYVDVCFSLLGWLCQRLPNQWWHGNKPHRIIKCSGHNGFSPLQMQNPLFNSSSFGNSLNSLSLAFSDALCDTTGCSTQQGVQRTTMSI